MQNAKYKNNIALLTSGIFALGITFYCLICFFYPINFSIPDDYIPLIGQSSKENVLVEARVNFFYKLVFTGTFLWISFTWFFQRIFNHFIKSTKQYTRGLYYIVPLIAFSYLFILGIDVEQVTLLLFGIFVIDLLRKIITNSSYFSKVNRQIPISFELTLGFTFLLHVCIHFFFGHVDWLNANSVLIILSALFLIQLKLYFLRNLLNKDLIKISIIAAAGIPFFIFLSIEYQAFSLEKNWFVVGYKNLFLVLQFLWVVTSWLIVKKQIRNFLLISTRIFVPSLIFGFCLLIFYQPIIPPSNELFELANPANSVMRVFKFGEIPILDFMSSHMLYEQWYGLLYQFIFGFSERIDFTIYSFLNLFIYLIIIYSVLKRVGFNDKASAIFIFFFPILHHVFFGASSYVFLVLFFIQHLSKNTTSKNVLYLFLLLFALVLWRIDTGVVAIFTTIIFLPIYWFLTQKKFPTLTFLKGLGYFICVLLVLTFIAVILRPWDQIWDNFLSALHYVKGSQAHGYANLFDGSYHQFYLFHVLFVAISIVLTVVAIYILKQKKSTLEESKNLWLVFSIFSFILFIANAQRGLVRHGFAEHSELFFSSTFYLGVAFFSVYLIRKRYRQFQYALFFTVLFFGFVGTKYFPFFPEKLNTSKMLKPEAFKNINKDLTLENYQGRVSNLSEFKEHTYGDLKSYMNQNLSPEQTFIDFSNTPMLYYYCERRVPGYFNQNLQNSIDDYLQLQLLEDYKQNDVPLVVYSSYPPSWFDATDGVLNSTRYYLISEYIFENYRPIGIINNYSVWGDKNRNWKKIHTQDTIVNQPLELNLGYLAGWEGNKYNSTNQVANNFSILKEKTLLVNDTSFTQNMVIDKELLTKNQIKLVLKVNPENKLNINESKSSIIFRDTTGREVHRVSFVRDDRKFQNYAVRLSNNYFWHQHETLIVEFQKTEGLEQVFLIKDHRDEH